tara:strand:- start:9168 stop:9437 length:270 start_codon:yes stop_codon:yes gene_type:complete
MRPHNPNSYRIGVKFLHKAGNMLLGAKNRISFASLFPALLSYNYGTLRKMSVLQYYAYETRSSLQINAFCRSSFNMQQLQQGIGYIRLV